MTSALNSLRVFISIAQNLNSSLDNDKKLIGDPVFLAHRNKLISDPFLNAARIITKKDIKKYEMSEIFSQLKKIQYIKDWEFNLYFFKDVKIIASVINQNITHKTTFHEIDLYVRNAWFGVFENLKTSSMSFDESLLQQSYQSWSSSLSIRFQYHFKKFLAQESSNFYQFITEIQLPIEENNFYLAFFKSLGMTSDDITFFRQVEENLFYELGCTPMEVMNTLTHHFINSNLVTIGLSRFYHLQTSKWHPSHPIDCLLDHLSQFGPHIIMGSFGKSYYLTEPSIIFDETGPITLKEMPVYTWSDSAEKRKDQNIVNPFLLVGGFKFMDIEKVYFLDPQESLNNQIDFSQKLYVMSYSELRSGISTLTRIKLSKDENVMYLNEGTDFNIYALHAIA